MYLDELTSSQCILKEHWPDTIEFITQTVELWNRWMRLSCCYNRVLSIDCFDNLITKYWIDLFTNSNRKEWILKCTLDKHAPKKESKHLKKNDTIFETKKQLDHWFRKEDFNQYRKCRNMYNSMIKNAKENYFNNAIKTNEHPTA